MSHKDEARQFALRIKAMGFTVYLAEDGHYGFITDETESRALGFSMRDGYLSGNYGPPSRESGTGWRMDSGPYDLHTADDVRAALNAYPPQWVGKGWKHLTTVAQHLAMYGASSRYVKV